jgi:outer membrane protein assembly factor BamA
MFNQAYSTTGDPDYISRMYYRMDRRFLRFRTNFQGKIIGRKLRWFAGATYQNLKLGTVDIDKLNKGKDESKQLPKVDGLYDKFIKEGLIPAEEATGGGVTIVSAGLVFDTRDNEPNPNKGVWSELLLLGSPGFLGSNQSYASVVLTHRQYFTIFPNRLTFAYRLNYQSTIAGQIPWYMMSFLSSSFENQEGLGGSKNLRGIMRNRVIGEGYVLGNFELRWKFVKFNFIGQNWYLALSPFLDAARITKPYEPFENYATVLKDKGFYGEKDGFHFGYGAGLHIALNQNFIVAVDYGLALNNKNGTKDDSDKAGLYIGLNFLF